MVGWKMTGATVALTLVANVAAGQTIAQQKEALQAIRETAAGICATVPLNAKQSNFELSGQAQAKIKGLASKIANLGVSGAGKYTQGASSGLLQKDLASAIKGSNECRLAVFNKLVEAMLPTTLPPRPPARPRQ